MVKHHSPGFLKLTSEAAARVAHCSVKDVQAWIQSGHQQILIDVREESEFASGRIPTAIHLSKGVIERDIERVVPDLSAKIVLYCGGGFRSVLAAENLQRMGYQNVLSMDGGWSGWIEAGNQAEK